jgi:hypothetical protein
MRFVKPVSLLLGTVLLTGCVLTKMVTVPMRVAGAGVSIIPVAGNVTQVVIDEAAEGVDKLPF